MHSSISKLDGLPDIFATVVQIADDKVVSMTKLDPIEDDVEIN